MTQERKKPRDMSKWEPISYVCRECGSQAVKNPDDDREWGCRKCNATTHSVFIHFYPKGDKK